MKLNLSPYVKKLKLKDGFWVLNHSLLMEQIYFKDLSLLNNSDFNKILFKKRFLNDEQTEKEIRDSIVKNANNDEFNLLRILLTDLCNLKCEYCKVCNNTAKPLATPSPIERVHDAVNSLFEKNTKPKAIHITGGEPLIFYDRVKEIISYIRDKYSSKNYKYIIIIGTNGVFLDQPKIDFFKKNKVKLIISLDGDKKANSLRVMRDGKSSYNHTVSAIEKLKKAKIEFGISMVIGSHNVSKTNKNIDEIIRKFNPSSLGVNFIKNTKIDKKSPYLISGKKYSDHIYAAHKANRENGTFLELLARKIFPFVSQKYRLYDCGASNGTTINIDASGNVGTCKSFLCLKAIYADKDIKKIIDQFKGRSPLFNHHCSNCYAQGICGNGCAYETKINDENNLIDKRACEYVVSFYNKFIMDIFDSNIEKAYKAIELRGYYVPSKTDRKKIIGRVSKNLMSLRQCIGHEI